MENDVTSPVDAKGFRVCIRQDPVNEVLEDEKYAALSAGGFVTDTKDEHARRESGQIWGTLVSIGETAFTGPDWQLKDKDGEVIKDAGYRVGDKVMFKRYAGTTFEGAGVVESKPLYRICNDSDVLANVTTKENLVFKEE